MSGKSPPRHIIQPIEVLETVDFITRIPTVWHESKMLNGVVGNFIAVARRNGG